MFGFNTIQTLGAGLVVVALASGGAYLKGRSDGASLAEARTAKATIEQLKERGLINEEVRNIPDCALARELNPDVVCDEQPD